MWFWGGFTRDTGLGCKYSSPRGASLISELAEETKRHLAARQVKVLEESKRLICKAYKGDRAALWKLSNSSLKGTGIIIPRQKTLCSSMIYFSQKKVGKPGNPRLRFTFIVKVDSMYCKVCKSSYDQTHLTLLQFLEKTFEYLEYKMLRITTVLLSQWISHRYSRYQTWYFTGLMGFHNFNLTDVMQNVLSRSSDPSVPIMIRNVFGNTQTL